MRGGGAQQLSTYDSSMSVGVREGWNQGELDIKTWSAKCGWGLRAVQHDIRGVCAMGFQWGAPCNA